MGNIVRGSARIAKDRGLSLGIVAVTFSKDEDAWGRINLARICARVGVFLVIAMQFGMCICEHGQRRREPTAEIVVRQSTKIDIRGPDELPKTHNKVGYIKGRRFAHSGTKQWGPGRRKGGLL
jgi:hypothetical protein